MRLLIVTQAVDQNDTTLGFFVRWISALASRFEHIHVICLREGSYDLPHNVTVHCLRNRAHIGRAHIVMIFLSFVWRLRRDYDSVFVHMNQEYVLIAGLFWRLMQKKVFLWRNHRIGDWKTALAVALSDKVFYTSTDSFTAHFARLLPTREGGQAKSVMMPAGIDVEIFQKSGGTERVKNSLLMFGRIAPIKHVELAIDVIASLREKDTIAHLSIVGDTLPKDTGYFESLKDRAEAKGVTENVSFKPGVPFGQAAAVYQGHEIFLNFTPSGSFDKTVIEALASGCKVMVTNESMKSILPTGSWTSDRVGDIAEKVGRLLTLDTDAQKIYKREAEDVLKRQSLDTLTDKLFTVISG